MSIRDSAITLNVYSNITNEVKGQFDYYNLKNKPQQLMTVMNLEEVMLWEQIKEMLIDKEDLRIAIGSKSY